MTLPQESTSKLYQNSEILIFVLETEFPFLKLNFVSAPPDIVYTTPFVTIGNSRSHLRLRVYHYHFKSTFPHA